MNLLLYADSQSHSTGWPTLGFRGLIPLIPKHWTTCAIFINFIANHVQVLVPKEEKDVIVAVDKK